MQQSNTRHDIVPFPRRLAGYVIGSEGRSIKDIANRTKARVWIKGEETHYETQWSYFHAVGTPREVDAAKCQLMLRIMHALDTQGPQRTAAGGGNEFDDDL